METRYIISGVGLSKEEYIEISREDMERLRDTKTRLINLMYFEEKFDILLENFLEYEQEVFRATLNKIYFPASSLDWSAGIGDIHAINRRLINLLTTTKLYLDQAVHDLNSVFMGASDNFTKLTRTEYDKVLGYRVLEALRNYVQHRGLPIHIMEYNVFPNEKRSSERSMLHSVSVHINLDKLKEDGKFKATVLNELFDMEEEEGLKKKHQVNIGKLLRQYVSSLGVIQNTMRTNLAEQLCELDAVLEDLYKGIEERYGKTEMVYMAELHPLGFHGNKVFISLTPINRRRLLMEKNRDFDTIDSHTATMDS
ncbi:hypothetical protein [Paenibacillus pabuli]|uniref:hypothetical protein n=1 Tax=Paenibacillus pabuli TaxID=1472 RepID=UPI003CF34BAD